MADIALAVGHGAVQLHSGASPQAVSSGPAGSLVVDAAPGASVEHVGPWSCVALARLDDRSALAKELQLRDDCTDARVLLASHERWGPRFPARLQGEFAFALWQRDSGVMLLGADCFGHYPLYYLSLRDGTWRVDTNLARLVTSSGWERAPDERAIVDYLAGFDRQKGSTAYREVRQVPPGHLVSITSAGASVSRYWRPEELALFDGSPRDCADQLRRELSRAVRNRLSSKGRTAVLLSGGLDSSAVACLAAEQSAEPVTAVSAVFTEGEPPDERPFQKRIVDASGLRYHPVPVAERPSLSLRGAIEVFGHPFPVGGHWLAEPCVSEAANAGADVVLTGLDGDRIVSHGHGHLAELTLERKWLQLADEVVVASTERSMLLRQAAGLMVAAALPKATVKRIDKIRRRRALQQLPSVRWLRPDALRRSGALEAVVAASERLWTARDYHLRALARTDRSADLEVFAGLERLRGIEGRHPFFDRRVAELCLSFPASQKRHQGLGRWVLREALSGVVPDPIRRRPDKAVFDGAFALWARRQHTSLDKTRLDFDNLESYLLPSAVAELRLGPVSGVPVDLLWRAMVVSAWLSGEVAS